jgi:hypothetical protein
LSCRRDLELHGPSIHIAIASLLVAVWRRPVRLGNIPIGILQILSADARLGPRRALSVSSAAALCASHRILRKQETARDNGTLVQPDR